MITVEAWTTIRYLHAQGKGKKTIARELGIARNTVRRALARPGPLRYQRPPRPNQQLAPYARGGVHRHPGSCGSCGSGATEAHGRPYTPS